MAGHRRGPARSQAAREAILDATVRLFAERGYEQLTIEGIAAAAGVGKQTIYRWWRSKAALVAECLFDGRLLPPQFVPPDTGDIHEDLAEWVTSLMTLADEPATGALFRALAAAAADDEAVGVGLGAAIAGADSLLGRLHRAADAGQLPAGASPELVADALIGTIIYRIVTRAPAPVDFGQRLVAVLLDPAASRLSP